MKYKFSENNSGGSWWLNREQYDKLFTAGWEYHATEYDKENKYDTQPHLDKKDSTVPYGWRHNLVGEFNSIREAVESFERATGQDFFEEGCNCCGAPFSIASEDHKEYLSGDVFYDIMQDSV